ncbi:MAG: endoribonuclease MazF [Bacillota bacterium]
MVKEHYIPDRGDLVWLHFNPQSGHEQSGKRPALALSPMQYNEKVGLALFCPVTSNAKGYPFEVVIPQDLPIEGVILSDQIKSRDWQSRQVKFICRVPKETLDEVLSRVDLLIH